MTKDITKEKAVADDLRYLQLLSRSFPTIADASTEIINLEAIMNLPKGTEHFLSDLHGEYQAFNHVLRNASGAIKRKVKTAVSYISDFEQETAASRQHTAAAYENACFMACGVYRVGVSSCTVFETVTPSLSVTSSRKLCSPGMLTSICTK